MATIQANFPGTVNCGTVSGNGAGITNLPIASLAGISPVKGHCITYNGSAWVNSPSGGSSTTSFFTTTGSWTTTSMYTNWSSAGTTTTVYFNIVGTQGTSLSKFVLTPPIAATLTAQNAFIGIAGFFVNSTASSGLQVYGNGSGSSYTGATFSIAAQGSTVSGSISGSYQYSTV